MMAEEVTHTAELPGSIPLNKFAHEIYARERALGQPITHAAERAGLSKRSGAGSKLETDEDVRARIAWLAREDDEIVREKRRRLEERQWLIHGCDISQFYDDVEELATDKDGNPILDKDGNPITRKRQYLRPFSEIPPELRMCIHSLTWTDSGRPNLKLYDKQEANREIRKLLGLDAPTKIAPTTADGSDIAPEESLEELTNAVIDLSIRLDSIASADGPATGGGAVGAGLGETEAGD
jgi:hypothetical protein